VAATTLLDQFHSGAPNLNVLVTARHGTVDSPAVAAAGREITRRLESEPNVANVQSYWQLGSIAALRADHGRQAVIAARIEGTQDQFVHREKAVAASLRHLPAAITVQLGGFAPAFSVVDELIERGVIISEAIAIPITMLLLLYVFGSVVAAAMPLTIAAVSVVGTLALLRLLSVFMEVSVFAENLTTAMGFALAIDYSLFLVSRYREERDAGFDDELALIRAVNKAGRMVLGSALTVMVALAVLLVFPITFLRSIAVAGMGVAILAGVGAVIVLPAALSMLGPRINAWTVWQRSIKPPDDGYWRRTAIRVMRHPLIYATAAVAFLMFLASPFLGIHLGYLDDKVLPLSNPVRQTDDTLRREFSSGQTGAIQVVIPSFQKGQPLAVTAETFRYAQSLSELPKVLRVESALGFFIKGQHVAVPTSYAAQYREPRGTWLSVVPTVDPLSVQAESVVTEVRTAPSPYRVQIGGLSAQFLDSTTLIEARMPLAFGLIGLAMFVLLFVLFGSIVIPIKAMVLNVFSLAATFGAMVWIFQDGHLFGVARLHGHGERHRGHPGDDVLRRLRALHGLRGLLDLADQGAARSGREQRGRGGHRSPAQRSHHHRGRPAAGGRLLDADHQPDLGHQAVRRRPVPSRPGRCLPDPGRAGPRLHEGHG
jgi:RND superfamily putative drug exporter